LTFYSAQLTPGSLLEGADTERNKSNKGEH
jgi:hypothetical protein